MKKYLILFTSKTSLRFIPNKATYRFEIRNLIISFRRIISQNDKEISRLADGWLIEVKVEADDLDKAIVKATEVTEFFLSISCLETGCEIYKSNIIIAYNIAEKVKKREFRQYFRNLQMSSKAEQVVFQTFSDHCEQIWNFDKKHKERILRAIRWFRKGIIDDDPIDQFLFFWHGLETLNTPLANHFNCEKSIIKKIKRKCKICEKEYSDSITTKGGIDALFDSLNINNPVRKRINDMRNGIAHGFANLSELYQTGIELVPIMADLLHNGIALVLKFSFKEELYENLKRVSPVKMGAVNYLEMWLIEENVSKLGIDNYYPFFIHKAETKPTEKGYEITSTFTPYVNCNYEAFAMGTTGSGIQVCINKII